MTIERAEVPLNEEPAEPKQEEPKAPAASGETKPVEQPQQEEPKTPAVGSAGEEKPKEETPAETPKEEEPAEGEEKPKEEEEEQTTGLTAEDRERYTQEIVEGGKLSDDSLEAIEKATGFDRETIEAYVEGQKAKAELATVRQEQQHQALYGHVGGQEEYAEIIKYAEENAPQAAKAFLNSTDMDSAKLALSGLQAMYSKANPVAPKLARGAAPSTASDTFKDANEYADAINDPRYSQSETYRRDVAAKAARSNIFN